MLRLKYVLIYILFENLHLMDLLVLGNVGDVESDVDKDLLIEGMAF